MIAKKKKYRVLGVMSGTSIDGVDFALVEFSLKPWKFKVLKTKTITYPKKWILILSEIHKLGDNEIIKIDKLYSLFLGKLINDFIKENEIKNIDLVSSHGHTARHIPLKGITYQLGNLSYLNRFYNLKTVCDFRTQDVDMGGQGAPLVPIGDQILFSEYSACINLGGFANISREINGERIAYDICSINLIFNYLAQKKSMLYDKNGSLAKSGNIINKLFEKLNKIEFYNLSYPKSLGVEWCVKEIFPLIDESLKKYKVEDVIRTYLDHVVIKISDCLNENDKVLITGGGANNKFFVSSLKNKTKAQIIIPSKNLIEYKEAVIFGFLGLLKILNINNCLSSATGAIKDHCSGKIIFAN